MKTKSPKIKPDGSPQTLRLREQLAAMYLTYVAQHFESMGQKAALDQSAHVDYLAQLIEGEYQRRADRSTERRVLAARLPVIKTLEQFNWRWPGNINQPQIRHLFRLGLIEEKGNVIFIGSVGIGKTHLATALAHSACLKGHSVPIACFRSSAGAMSAVPPSLHPTALSRIGQKSSTMTARLLRLFWIGCCTIPKRW